MEKVITFCEHFKVAPLAEIQKPIKSGDMSSIVDSWHAQYIDLEDEILFELLLAANYLDIGPLLELSSCKIASKIKDWSIDKIRDFFGIENDFTPEEYAQILEENKWAEQAL